MTPLRVLAALLMLLTLGALAAGIAVSRHMGNPLADLAFVVPIGLSGVIYLAAAWWVLRPGSASARGPSLMLVLGVAAVLRLALLLGPPMLSSDIYRYVWDGRVQNAGINPYLYLPVDPHLAPLRDQAIYPHINRADYAPTIYPPAAQMLFAAVSAVSDSVLAMKVAMVAMEALAILCLLRLLRRAGLPSTRVLIYAWNPVAIWEFAGNGHVDAAAIGLLAAAMLLRGSLLRDGWAGAVLGGAVLVKFLPAVAAPALWRRGTPGFRFAAGGAAVAGVLYAAYMIFGGAGAKVLGFLGAYGTEEGLSSGSGIWLLAGLGSFGPLPAWGSRLYLAMAAAGLLALGLWIALRPRPQAGSPADVIRMSGDVAIVAAATMAVLSPHYAWYFPWLALPATLAPSRSVIWLSVAAMLLYFAPFENRFLWQSLVFGPAAILACLDIRTARRTPGLLVIQP